MEDPRVRCKNPKCKKIRKPKCGRSGGFEGGLGYCSSCYIRSLRYGHPPLKDLPDAHIGSYPLAYDEYLKVVEKSPWLTEKRIGEIIGVSRRTVQRYARRKREQTETASR